jgi:hypothetical protein
MAPSLRAVTRSGRICFKRRGLSLGLVGVATQIEIDVLPAYHLEERIESHPLSRRLKRAGMSSAAQSARRILHLSVRRARRAEDAEPSAGRGAAEAHERHGRSRVPHGLRCLCGRAVADAASAAAHRAGRACVTRRVGPAYQIFPSDRTVRFEEMEYELPRANGFGSAEGRDRPGSRKKLPVTFPFEFRLTAADDIWLSPFNGTPGASISMHQYAKMPWRDLFAEAEPIFRAHGGRPHWAKRHTLDRARRRCALSGRGQVQSGARRRHDPGAKFANAHLMQTFDIQERQA